MEEKKFELTDETIKLGEHTLHRIKALKDFYFREITIYKGDLGGFIETEDNLSQEGNCWVSENALVYGNAKVYEDAQIWGDAEVWDNAKVYGTVIIGENAKVYEDAKIYDNAKVFCTSFIHGNAQVYENAYIFNNALVYGNTKIHGNGHVCGNVDLCGDAEVEKISDYMVFRNTWSDGIIFTWTRSNNMWRVGGFYGTGEQLIKKGYAESKDSGKKYEKYVKFVETFDD